MAVGDFNGDGKPDLAVANQSYGNDTAGKVSVLLNTCGSGIDLAIVRGGTTFTLSWPFPSAGFVLESTRSLSPPDWMKADDAQTLNNDRLEITALVDQRQRYFRLRKP